MGTQGMDLRQSINPPGKRKRVLFLDEWVSSVDDGLRFAQLGQRANEEIVCVF